MNNPVATFFGSPESTEQEPQEQAWLPPTEEGELAVDIFREDNQLVIRSPVAGVAPEQLEISVHGDLLTIRGVREQQREINEDDWFARECYWGSFSRSIILPVDVESDQTQASIKNGLLEVRLPIRGTEQRVTVHAIEQE